MKNPLLFLVLLFSLTAAGCHKSKSTNTRSDTFSTLASKQAFLESYVAFRRSYEDLHFHISFTDGGAGILPGPTEWDIRLMAVIPAEEMDEWISGLTASDSGDTKWALGLPEAPADLARFVWFEDDCRLVGLDRASRIVLYRNHAF